MNSALRRSIAKRRMRKLRQRGILTDGFVAVDPNADELHGLRGKIGRYITPELIGSDGPFPTDMDLRLLKTITSAERFAEKAKRLENTDAHALGEKRLAEAIAKDDRSGSANLLRAIFWHVAGMSVVSAQGRLPTSQHTPSIFGAECQSALTRAYLSMTPYERKGACNRLLFHRSSGGERWKIVCHGAFAVARVAYNLLAHGIPAILPTREIDMFAKIDLIGDISDAKIRLLCFQIKTSALCRETNGFFLADYSPNELDGELRDIRRNIALFAERNSITCFPIALTVANDRMSEWDIRGGQRLRWAIEEVKKYTGT